MKDVNEFLELRKVVHLTVRERLRARNVPVDDDIYNPPLGQPLQYQYRRRVVQCERNRCNFGRQLP